MINSNFSTKKDLCEICGTEYEQNKKGRRKLYCSSKCQHFAKYKNLLETELLKINFRGKYANQMKGDLFRMANLIQCKVNKK